MDGRLGTGGGDDLEFNIQLERSLPSQTRAIEGPKYQQQVNI